VPASPNNLNWSSPSLHNPTSPQSPSWLSQKLSNPPSGSASQRKLVRTPRSSSIDPANNHSAAASREAMAEARLPLAYRDSCANLLIPLNRCRYEEYYLPWKCEVSPHLRGIRKSWETRCWRLKQWGLVLIVWVRRQRDIVTRSASTKNSRSGLRRWMSWGQRRMGRGAIDGEMGGIVYIQREYIGLTHKGEYVFQQLRTWNTTRAPFCIHRVLGPRCPSMSNFLQDCQYADSAILLQNSWILIERSENITSRPITVSTVKSKLLI